MEENEPINLVWIHSVLRYNTLHFSTVQCENRVLDNKVLKPYKAADARHY